ncbi:uncharacterized protein LOC128202492 [Galleria mellonella]|uniref:Uncharacterized protein LOC128202492 n=1 Tax=Galleria mellonella TaxID=7137 RepID=A0ABM3N616_GALME|nr:uncharacterized protein LOC128202492 [Galleria mellonella]
MDESEDDNYINISDKSDMEFPNFLTRKNHCIAVDQDVERTIKRKNPVKSDGSSEDSFTSIIKRKSKKFSKGDTITPVKKVVNETQEAIFEVSVSSLEALPKQIALAKLLRSLTISNIVRIKYKNPYKILIRFEKKENAEKLINCQKFKDLGYKCQMTYENNITYGIIKGIDIDMNVDELLDIINCPHKILSMKRLNRLNSEGKWVESETVRICFESSILPDFVYAYGCRFRVEKYVFPVTQCSICWKFGHSAKFCASKKVLCPKCGGSHNNCDTKIFTCLNCKGIHMSLDKQCPIFIKEKNIRLIMSRENVSYRKALQIIDEKDAVKTINLSSSNTLNITGPSINLRSQEVTERSFSSVVKSKAVAHKDELIPDLNIEKEAITDRDIQSTKKLSKDDICKEDSNILSTNIDSAKAPQAKQETRTRFQIGKILIKIKENITSEKSFEEKIMSVLKIIAEECYLLMREYIKEGDVWSSIFSIFYG